MAATAPTLDDVATALDARVTRLLRLAARSGRREQSRTAMSVLATLAEHGPRRVTELAAAEVVAQPTMTTLVGRLAREGLVERGADPGDGRATLVAITPAGRALLARRTRERSAFLAERLAALDPADRERLAAALPALERLTA